jgi:hypothetical protein
MTVCVISSAKGTFHSSILLLQEDIFCMETYLEKCLLVKVNIHPSNGYTAQIVPWPPPLRFLNHTKLDTW